MLYIKSTDNRKTYTAHQVLISDHAPDGDIIVPVRLPQFTDKELLAICSLGFSGAIAHILNIFFSKKIKESTIKALIDSVYPSSSVLDRKTLLISFDDRTSDLENNIYKILTESGNQPTLWARCAIRIGVLFGIYSEVLRCGIDHADFAVDTENVERFISVFYAKLMGLPIRHIIIGSTKEDSIWSYLHKGVNISDDLLRYFIYGASLGANESTDIADLFSSIISMDRMKEILNGVQRSYNKEIDLTTACAYGALQDFRALTGKNNITVIICN